MAEQTWNAARLIPTSGISGPEEQERRATSALLAVMNAVKEFGRAITMPLGAPAGTMETSIVVPFDFEERRVFPDGLIRVRRGTKTWTALVEVKTKTNPIEREQLGCYLDVAREQGYDAVITVSNEIASTPGAHPADDTEAVLAPALDPGPAEETQTANTKPRRRTPPEPADQPPSPWWTTPPDESASDETAGAADGVASAQPIRRIGEGDGHAGIEAIGLNYLPTERW